jgi:predicted Zn finger-like uncharacterized protein
LPIFSPKPPDTANGVTPQHIERNEMNRNLELPNAHHTKIKLTCARCGKTYRIRKEKIPAGATAVRCKACGKHVRLKYDIAANLSLCHPAGVLSAAAGGVGKPALCPPRARLDLMTEEKRRRPRRKYRSGKLRPV